MNLKETICSKNRKLNVERADGKPRDLKKIASVIILRI
jgi:hypothetical protein